MPKNLTSDWERKLDKALKSQGFTVERDWLDALTIACDCMPANEASAFLYRFVGALTRKEQAPLNARLFTKQLLLDNIVQGGGDA